MQILDECMHLHHSPLLPLPRVGSCPLILASLRYGRGSLIPGARGACCCKGLFLCGLVVEQHLEKQDIVLQGGIENHTASSHVSGCFCSCSPKTAEGPQALPVHQAERPAYEERTHLHACCCMLRPGHFMQIQLDRMSGHSR